MAAVVAAAVVVVAAELVVVMEWCVLFFYVFCAFSFHAHQPDRWVLMQEAQ